MTLIFLTLSGMFFLAAIHPFLTYPLSLLWLRRFARYALNVAETAAKPTRITLCFCAYNEERVIDAKIENLVQLRRAIPDIEILTYVDAATDQTANRLGEHRELLTLYVSPDRRGKTHGMNLLATKATAPIIVFTDANVIVDPEGLLHLARYFTDPQIGCVCGHLIYRNASASVTAATGSLYWRLEEWIKQAETETGSAIGADGSLFAIRRQLHHPVPDDIIDDMFLSLSILCDGFRVVRAPDVIAHEDSVSSGVEEFQRKIRIACQSFNVHRLLWPRLRCLAPLTLYKYISHKLMRWFAIYFLAFSGLCFEAALVVAGFPFLGLALGVALASALLAGWRWRIVVLTQAADILVALLGAGAGICQSIRGKRYQTWTSSTSIRSGTRG
jgi:cellulose synthase/poly-beta-1,6-N-acetylglucosamine synthase-like glycosyltransferase